MKITHLKVQIDTAKPTELYVFAHQEGTHDPIGMLKIGLDEKHTGWISAVFVREDARGKGAGRKMLEHAIETCRQMNKAYVSLAVADKNKAAKKLYKALGFKPFMTGQKGYYQYIKVL